MLRKRIYVNSPVVLGFSGLCLLALILGYVTGGFTNTLLFSVYRSPLTSPFTYLRLIGHVFGHSGIEHFTGNIMMILVVGPLLEEKYGSKTILLTILATALVTGLAFSLLFPSAMLLGASGVVFAMILLSSFTSIREGKIPLTVILVAMLYIGNQIITGLAVQDNVSNMTHILGGLVGAFVGYRVNYRNK